MKRLVFLALLIFFYGCAPKQSSSTSTPSVPSQNPSPDTTPKVQASPEPEKPSVVDLIGKDYDGVIALMGRQPDWTGHDSPISRSYEWMRWRYDKSPFPGYQTEIHFEQFPPHPVTDSFKTVHWIIISKTLEQFGSQLPFVPVKDIVSSKVLNEEPSGIYIGWPGGISKVCVVVIWHLNGRTYCLETADSSRVPWKEEKKVDSHGQLIAVYSLTKQANEFRDFDQVWSLYVIDSQPKLVFSTVQLYNTPKGECNLHNLRFYKSPYFLPVPQY